jgi:glutamate--cysteine ligase
MGQIDVRSGSAHKVLDAAAPALRQAVYDAAFGAGAGVGVEIEFLAFEHGRAASLGQSGATLSPGAFVERLAAAAGAGAELVRDPLNGYPCGVGLPHGGKFSLENGGQIEYASGLCAHLDAVAAELADALAQCERAAAGEVGFLSHGTHPTLEARLDPLVPNSRYRIMEHFFAPDSIHKWGNYASSIQVNLDVAPGPGWQDAVRLGFALSRFSAHLFANSRFLHDRPYDGDSARLSLVAQMDPERRAVPSAVIAAPDFVEAYVQWALDASVIFAGDLPVEQLPRRGELTFRTWLDAGYQGLFPREEDWKLHLGTLWPDLRPRRFLELRANDAQPFQFVMAVVAFWQAVIQLPAGREAAWGVIASLDGAGATRESALLNVLDRPFGDALLKDPVIHQALLSAAADTLETASPCWAATVRSYQGFLAEKPRYWGNGSAAHFLSRAIAPHPTADFQAFNHFPTGALEQRIAPAQTGRLVPAED